MTSSNIFSDRSKTRINLIAIIVACSGFVIEAVINKVIEIERLPNFVSSLLSLIPYLLFFLGIALFIYYHIKWKIDDNIANRDKQIKDLHHKINSLQSILIEVLNNHATHIEDIKNKYVRHIDAVTYTNPKDTEAMTPLDIDILCIQDEEEGDS